MGDAEWDRALFLGNAPPCGRVCETRQEASLLVISIGFKVTPFISFLGTPPHISCFPCSLGALPSTLLHLGLLFPDLPHSGLLTTSLFPGNKSPDQGESPRVRVCGCGPVSSVQGSVLDKRLCLRNGDRSILSLSPVKLHKSEVKAGSVRKFKKPA